MRTEIKADPRDRGYVQREGRECAVSPVVGVMLMLVVVVIIAAVVSAFGGTLVGSNNQKAPTLNMDVKISNTGNWRGSEVSMDVLGVSEPIPTRDLKIVTSWTTTVKTNYYYTQSGGVTKSTGGVILGLPNGTVYHGGATVLPGVTNAHTQKTAISVAPYGFGPGVGDAINANLSETIGIANAQGVTFDTVGPKVPIFNWQDFPVTHWGNYSLVQGTVMMGEAGGRCIYFPATGGAIVDKTYKQGGYGSSTRGSNSKPRTYAYVSTGGVYQVYTGSKTTPTDIIADGGQIDAMQAILGIGWENLRAGDVVNFKIVHIPSGKTILDKDVAVTDS
jgi:hypothetical protein